MRTKFWEWPEKTQPIDAHGTHLPVCTSTGTAGQSPCSTLLYSAGKVLGDHGRSLMTRKKQMVHSSSEKYRRVIWGTTDHSSFLLFDGKKHRESPLEIDFWASWRRKKWLGTVKIGSSRVKHFTLLIIPNPILTFSVNSYPFLTKNSMLHSAKQKPTSYQFTPFCSQTSVQY